MALPARMVDFEQTDAQNEKIRERAKDPHTVQDDGSLYSKVMRDKEKLKTLMNSLYNDAIDMEIQ